MTTYYSVSKCKYMCFTKHKPNLTDMNFLTGDLDSMMNIIDELINDNTKTYNIVIDAESEAFKDIVFNFDESNIKINSETLKQDILGGGLLGSSTMLDALSDGVFSITPGRKAANIPILHPSQNHDIIDAVASNGLLSSPKVISEYSVGKLLTKISKLNSFNIYVIHSALKVDKFDGSYPSTYCIPRYSVGDGEVLSVFFRYISLIFFGYMSVFDFNDTERKYDI